MIKTIATLFAAAVLSMGAHAATATQEVPVELVEINKVTQVVVSDGQRTYVMATQEQVEDTVLVTAEMANNAIPFAVMDPVYPKIFSVDQAANSGESDGTTTPFTKTGRMEPVTSMVTTLKKVYFQHDNKVYAFETEGEVGDTVKLTPEMLAMASVQVGQEQ